MIRYYSITFQINHYKLLKHCRPYLVQFTLDKGKTFAPQVVITRSDVNKAINACRRSFLNCPGSYGCLGYFDI